MNAILTRQPNNGYQIAGTLNIHMGGKIVFTCCTIEPPYKNNQRRVSCVPTGTYPVKKRWSPRFKHHFHVQDVPGRTWILIHAGNFRKNSTGCILVGRQHKDINGDGFDDLPKSRATLADLLRILPDSFLMEVRNA
jgi:hypothetical protein